MGPTMANRSSKVCPFRVKCGLRATSPCHSAPPQEMGSFPFMTALQLRDLAAAETVPQGAAAPALRSLRRP